MITDVFDIESEYYKEMMNIIIYSKLNKPEKGNIHHIIPKCYYKHYNMEIDNSISNTVLLTWENHKKVHNLAYKCAKHFWLKNKLAFACHRFGDTEPNITFTEETRKKISESLKGRVFTEEWKNKISETKKGKPRSEETKKKLSEAHKGKSLSEETKKKLSDAHKGKKITEETRQKLVEAGKNRIVSSETRAKLSKASKGRKLSEETKKKISETKKKMYATLKGKQEL